MYTYLPAVQRFVFVAGWNCMGLACSRLCPATVRRRPPGTLRVLEHRLVQVAVHTRGRFKIGQRQLANALVPLGVVVVDEALFSEVLIPLGSLPGSRQ